MKSCNFAPLKKDKNENDQIVISLVHMRDCLGEYRVYHHGTDAYYGGVPFTY